LKIWLPTRGKGDRFINNEKTVKYICPLSSSLPPFALDDYYDSDRPGYYRTLQSVSPDTLDLTQWLEYFTRGVMVQIEQVRQRIIGLSLDVQKMKDFGQVAQTERQMKIVEAVNKSHKITAGDIAAMFGISRQSALKEAGKLMEMNVLTPVGKGRGVG
jgi:Fic family protein